MKEYIPGALLLLDDSEILFMLLEIFLESVCISVIALSLLGSCVDTALELVRELTSLLVSLLAATYVSK